MVRMESISFLGGKARCFSGFDGAVPAQPYAALSNHEAGSPFVGLVAPRNANYAARIVGRLFGVRAIDLVIRISQIANTVVSFVAVDVVEAIIRPLAVVDGPADSVGKKAHIHNPPREVAVLADAGECLSSGVFLVPCERVCLGGRNSAPAVPAWLERLSTSRLPKQLACLGLIAKQLAAQFGCDIGSGSHGEGSFRGGQGRAALARCSGLNFIAESVAPRKQRSVA